MWKAAFTGRSETGSTTQGKKSRGTESIVSTSSRKSEDGKRRLEKSRSSRYDDDDTSTYATAPSSRNGEPRGLTESVVRKLDNDDDWEDEDKDARSERRSRKSDGTKRRSKSEKEGSDSPSRVSRNSGKNPSRQESETSRGKSRKVDKDDDRAIPDQGSFEQFPGQYSGGHMGSSGQPTEFMMSGALSSADNQFGPSRRETFGAASDYYQDEGESVTYQPGNRATTPNMLVNPDHHLMAASVADQPAQDTGHGSAADFYDGKVSPVPFDNQPAVPGRQSSGSGKKPKPSRMSSLGSAVAATAAAVGATGLVHGSGLENSNAQSQSEYQSSSTRYRQQGNGSTSSAGPSRKPSRQNSAPVGSSSGASRYETSSRGQQESNISGKQPSLSNAGPYTAGAAAAVGATGLAAYETNERNQRSQQEYRGQDERATSYSQFSGEQSRGLPSSRPQQGESTRGLDTGTSQQNFHEHKGPITRLKDGLLNLISSEEDVVKMEMYTEYIGVCKHCFDPRTSPTDAPRVHHYHASSRQDSFESLRKRRSIDRMRRSSREQLGRSNSNRVDKDSRYHSSDGLKRRKSSDRNGLATAAGVAAGVAGTAAVASAFSHDRKNFDDTYSVKSGHRESSAARRRSRSSSREQNGRSSRGVVGRDGKDEYVTVRTKDGRVEKRKVRRSRSTSKERTSAALGARPSVSFSTNQNGRRTSPTRIGRSRSSSRSNSPGGFFGFFSPSRSSKKREGSKPDRKKKQTGLFNFGNGSFSSDSELAFGASRTDLPLRRKSPTKSSKRKTSDEHLAATVAGIGVTAAALAAAQNGRRVNPKVGRTELGAKRDAHVIRESSKDHRYRSPGASEDEWEDELPSDVEDASSVGSDLAFGDYERRASERQSNGGAFSGWGFGSREEDKKRYPEPRPEYSDRYNTSAMPPVDDRLRRTESVVTSTPSIPERPMQEVDPRPISETASYSNSRHASIPGTHDSFPTVVRPGPGPLQHPKPIAPIQPSFVQSPPPMDSGDDQRRPRPRRTQSSPTQSHFFEDAAVIGAAAVGTAGLIAASGRKSKESSGVRWGLTEEQERKHDRELRDERDRAETEKQRLDREGQAKKEALRYTREQDVLRAREAENRRAAEAELERQRTAQREADQQAEDYRRQEREHQAQEQAARKRDSYRPEQDARSDRYEAAATQQSDTRQIDGSSKQSSIPWDAIAAGTAATAAGAFAVNEYDRWKDAPHEQVLASAEHADLVRRMHEIGGATGSDHFAKTAHASSAGPSRSIIGAETAKSRDATSQYDYDQGQEAYIQEIRPSDVGFGGPTEDEDIYDPEYFRRGARSPADFAKHAELARKAASKVVDVQEMFDDQDAYYAKTSQSQADFFAPDEILHQKAEGKTKVADPIDNNDVQVFESPEDEALAKFESEWAVKPSGPIKFAPWGVPKLGLVSPTPPPSALRDRHRSSTSPTPLSRAVMADSEPEAEVEAKRSSSRNRSVSWGADRTHVYDVVTPEVGDERESYVDHRDVATGVAAAATVAGVAAGTAAVNERADSTKPSATRESATERDMSGIESIADEDEEEDSSTQKQPFYETVSDAHLPGISLDPPGTDGAPRVKGLVEGEVDEPAQVEEMQPHIPGGFDVEYRESGPVAPYEKSITAEPAETISRDAGDDAAIKTSETERTTNVEDASTVDMDEEFSQVPKKLSKKEKRRLEKEAKRSSTLDENQPAFETPSRDLASEDPIPEPERPRDSSTHSKQGLADVAGAVMTAGGIAAITGAATDSPKETSRSKKGKKSKRSREAERDIRDVEPSVDGAALPPSSSGEMPGSWDPEQQEKDAEPATTTIDPFQYQVHDGSPGPPHLKSEATQDTSVVNVSLTPHGTTRATEISEAQKDGYFDENAERAFTDDAHSVASAPTGERYSRRSSKGKSKRESDYYDEPENYDDGRSVAASEPVDAYEKSRRSKRRSRSGDDIDTSPASTRSRREKVEQDSPKDKKSGFFGGLFGRKSAEAKSDGDSLRRQSTKDSKEDEREFRERRRRSRTGSEYGDDNDDAKSTSSGYRQGYERKPPLQPDDEDTSWRDEAPPNPSRRSRRDLDDIHDQDQSFLGMGVEDMPPLPDDASVAASSAPLQHEEQDVGMPASTDEPHTEIVSREHADAFDLVRHGQHERSAVDAFDLIAPHELREAEAHRDDHDAEHPASTDIDWSPQHREQHLQDEGSMAMPRRPLSPDDSPAVSPEADWNQRRISLNRPLSSTAVPLRFGYSHGQVPPTPSPRIDRNASFGGSMPASPATPISGQKTRQNRPGSTEIRPLYLVERNRKVQELEDTLPSLPSSKTTSRASSHVGSDAGDAEYESAAEGFSSPERRRDLTIDTSRANTYEADPDYLDSQQTTPRASEAPKPVFEKLPKQQPQFYTWEEYVQDERLHSAGGEDEREHSEVHDTSREYRQPPVSEDDLGDLPALPLSRPESRTGGRTANELGTSLATVAALGGTAFVADRLTASDAMEQDIPAEAPAMARTMSQSSEVFEASERVMEDGEVSVGTQSRQFASTSKPNELDYFMQAEDEMEEGRADAGYYSNARVDTSQYESNESRDLVDEAYARADAQDAEETEHVRANRGDTATSTSMEPALKRTLPAEESMQASEAPMIGDDPNAAGSEQRGIHDVEAQQQDDADVLPGVSSAPELTRKLSKKDKKKQQKVSAKKAAETIGSSSMDSFTDVVGQQTSGDDDLSSRSVAPADVTMSDEVPEEIKTRETVATESVSVDAEDESFHDAEEGPEPLPPTVPLDADQSQVEMAEPVALTEDPVLESIETGATEAGAADAFEDVPFVTRKKSKKDKRKRREKVTFEDEEAEAPRDDESAEMGSLRPATEPLSATEGPESEQDITVSQPTKATDGDLDSRYVISGSREVDPGFAGMGDGSQDTESTRVPAPPTEFEADFNDAPMPDAEDESRDVPSQQLEEAPASSSFTGLEATAGDRAMEDATLSHTLDQDVDVAPETVATPAEEPSEEFNWTSSSKKKGKKGKKDKRQSIIEQPVQEEAGVAPVAQPETSEPTSSTEPPEQQAEEAQDMWSFPTSTKKKGKKDKRQPIVVEPVQDGDEVATASQPEISHPTPTNELPQQQTEEAQDMWSFPTSTKKKGKTDKRQPILTEPVQEDADVARSIQPETDEPAPSTELPEQQTEEIQDIWSFPASTKKKGKKSKKSAWVPSPEDESSVALTRDTTQDPDPSSQPEDLTAVQNTGADESVIQDGVEKDEPATGSAFEPVRESAEIVPAAFEGDLATVDSVEPEQIETPSPSKDNEVTLETQATEDKPDIDDVASAESEMQTGLGAEPLVPEAVSTAEPEQPKSKPEDAEMRGEPEMEHLSNNDIAQCEDQETFWVKPSKKKSKKGKKLTEEVEDEPEPETRTADETDATARDDTLMVDTANTETVAQTDAVVEEPDVWSIPFKSKKGKKGKKSKQVVDDEPEPEPETRTVNAIDPAAGEDTLMTDTADAEAVNKAQDPIVEAEDIWSKPAKGKKGKKAKKGKDVVEDEPVPTFDSVDDREAAMVDDTPMADADPAIDETPLEQYANAEDIWSTPTTGKKGKKSKKSQAQDNDPIAAPLEPDTGIVAAEDEVSVPTVVEPSSTQENIEAGAADVWSEPSTKSGKKKKGKKGKTFVAFDDITPAEEVDTWSGDATLSRVVDEPIGEVPATGRVNSVHERSTEDNDLGASRNLEASTQVAGEGADLLESTPQSDDTGQAPAEIDDRSHIDGAAEGDALSSYPLMPGSDAGIDIDLHELSTPLEMLDEERTVPPEAINDFPQDTELQDVEDTAPQPEASPATLRDNALSTEAREVVPQEEAPLATANPQEMNVDGPTVEDSSIPFAVKKSKKDKKKSKSKAAIFDEEPPELATAPEPDITAGREPPAPDDVATAPEAMDNEARAAPVELEPEDAWSGFSTKRKKDKKSKSSSIAGDFDEQPLQPTTVSGPEVIADRELPSADDMATIPEAIDNEAGAAPAEVEPEDAWSGFSMKRKKDKKKDKKSKSSSKAEDFDEQPLESSATVPGLDMTADREPPIVDDSTARPEILDLEASPAPAEDEQEGGWAGFSTKRSKKEKRKSKQSKSLLPLEDESTPFESATIQEGNESQSMRFYGDSAEAGAGQAKELFSGAAMDVDQSNDPSEPVLLTNVLPTEDATFTEHKRESVDAEEPTSDDRDVQLVTEDQPEVDLTRTEVAGEQHDASMADIPSQPFRNALSEGIVDTPKTEKVFDADIQSGLHTEPMDIVTHDEQRSITEDQTTNGHDQNDIDFAATVAAGLAGSNFDSDMVLQNPTFSRRASPPGVAEADPEEFFQSASRKRKKDKKGKKRVDASDDAFDDSTTMVATSTTEATRGEDLDNTLKQTLEGTGFDPTILQSAAYSSNDVSTNEAAGDAEVSFATSMRKKSKKPKRGESALFAETQPSSTIDEAREIGVDTGALSRSEDPVTARNPDEETLEYNVQPMTDYPSRTESQGAAADLMMAGDRDMDVDEMDKAYRAFKKSKRVKKKQKSAVTKVTEAAQSEPSSEPMSEVERSTRPSDVVEDAVPQPAPLNHPHDYVEMPMASNEESRELGRTGLDTSYVTDHQEPISDVPQGQDRYTSGSEGVYATTEAAAGAAGISGGLVHGASKHRRRSDYSPGDGSDRGLGLLPNDHQQARQATAWSFANLEDEGLPILESPLIDAKKHEVVRDSGYQEADSPLLQRNSAGSAASAQHIHSQESLHERRSGEPLRISPDAGSGWNMHVDKHRDAGAYDSSETLHARTGSHDTDATPLESTTRNRASYLFQSTPDNLRETDLSHSNSPTSQARPTSDILSPAEPTSDPFKTPSVAADEEPLARAPLSMILEEQPPQGQKRAINETGLRLQNEESAKATRRSETPPSIRSRERHMSPSNLPPMVIPSAESRSITSPPLNDYTEQSSRRRSARQGSSDIRSGSAMSSRSNVSAGQFRPPDDLRSYSRASNRSSTPTLRRVSLSGDLRAASRRGDSGSAVGARSSPKTIPFEPPPTPPLNEDEAEEGASRSVTMSDVYHGYGDAEASQTSPTRPPNMRKRQSMHIMDLESKLDQLAAENQALQDARQDGQRSFEGGDVHEALNARELQLREKDNEINQIRTMLESLQDEVARLSEMNNGLTEANRNLVDDSNGQYGNLRDEHSHAHEQWQNTSRELDDVRQENNRLNSSMRGVVEAEVTSALADKNSEIQHLREELDVATEKIRALQVQIQSSRSRDFLTVRDEDYFDGACQKLCQHVQQWVLRFSKLSDDRKCRLSTDLKDDRIEARLDNAILDGSDVDKLLSDRIKRRDVFMSVVMTMVWEYVFTRYLFGMDREQRKKLKDLEKLLDDVGPKRAVAQWRATTLTLLSKRPLFAEQRDRDTEAVANEIFDLLCRLLPPPSSSEQQLSASLQKVVGVAVDLSVEMRCQLAEYIMLPPLQPEYDTNGDLAREVHFNSSLMNERSGTFKSNGELEEARAVVRIVLFPVVIKKEYEDNGGAEETVVCPAQVLVQNEGGKGKRVVRVNSNVMQIDDPARSQTSLVSTGVSPRR